MGLHKANQTSFRKGQKAPKWGHNLVRRQIL